MGPDRFLESRLRRLASYGASRRPRAPSKKGGGMRLCIYGLRGALVRSVQLDFLDGLDFRLDLAPFDQIQGLLQEPAR